MQTDRMTVEEFIVLDKADLVIREDGSIMANPRVGRIGIQLYKGTELGRVDLDTVRVYRPENEVMDKKAMASVTHRPVTNDHPPEPVTADNWKKYAVGHTGDTVARDGEFIRVPMMLSDARVISDFHNGKKQLSLGYTSNLEWRSGQTPQGDAYDAVQTGIRINHLAVVDAARGGSKLTIGDSVSVEPRAVDLAARMIGDGRFDKTADFNVHGALAIMSLCNGDQASLVKFAFVKDGVVYRKALESIKALAVTDQMAPVAAAAGQLLDLMDAHKGKRNMDPKLTTIMVDNQPLEVSDLAASTILRKLQGMANESSDLASKFAMSEEKRKKMEAAQAEGETETAKNKKKMEEDAATIVTLQKQLADAQITPQKLDALVRDRSVVIAKGQALIGDALVVDGKTNEEMRKQVVTVKLGDACKDWNDGQLASSFATLTAAVNVDDKVSVTDAMRRTFNGKPVPTNDKEKAYDGYDKKISDAWKGAAA